MSYRNPLHGLDSDGEPEPKVSEPGATVSGVTADHIRKTTLPTGEGVIIIDIAAINQRELERRVAAGEPLPEGVTAEQVAAWHDEFSGPAVVTIDDATTDATTTPVYEPPDTVPDTALVSVVDAYLTPIMGEDADDPAVRCPAACGLPADPEVSERAKVGCPVHPDGAHRCYRRPRHQYGQSEETDFRLTPADHECDCGFIWTNLVGGLDQFKDQVQAARAEAYWAIMQAIAHMNPSVRAPEAENANAVRISEVLEKVRNVGAAHGVEDL